MNQYIKTLVILALGIIVLAGCAGQQAFNHLARSGVSGTHGDTVAVATGWKKTFSRNTLTVTITDSVGAQTIYSPGAAEIRAVINMYPDPVANIMVSRETGFNTSPSAATYAFQIAAQFTDFDKDWWQTIVFVDLPNGMGLGAAKIEMSTLEEGSYTNLEIVSGDGSPNPFSAFNSWSTPEAESYLEMNSDQLGALERAGHYQIDFTGGATVPAAISIDLIHDAEVAGVTKAFVVNPTGEIKNIHWNDDGTTAKVLILPASSVGFSSLKDFKFYVAGGVTNLGVGASGVKAYDIDGFEIPLVTATITPR